MVSQVVFVVSVWNDGKLNLGSIEIDPPYYITCGYSPVAIIGVIVLGVFILLYTIGVGYLPLEWEQMPIAESNSRLIERVCMLEEPRSELGDRPLKWGVRRGQKAENEWISEFSDLPICGGETELSNISRGRILYHEEIGSQYLGFQMS